MELDALPPHAALLQRLTELHGAAEALAEALASASALRGSLELPPSVASEDVLALARALRLVRSASRRRRARSRPSRPL